VRGVVDHERCAKSAACCDFVDTAARTRTRHDDACPHRTTNLNCRRAHARSTCMHERRAAGGEAALQDERIPRGDEHLGDRRRIDEQHATRRAHGLSGGDGEIFGVGAARDDAHHVVARFEARRCRGCGERRGCGDDFAGKLHAGNVEFPRKRVWVEPAALQQVGAIECGGVHTHEQFVGSRYGHWHLSETQHFWPTKLGEHDRPHRVRHGAGSHGADRHGAGRHRYQALAIFSCRRRSIDERNSSVVCHG